MFYFKDCLAPTNPTNGIYNFTLTTFGAQATLTCTDGYTSDVTSVSCTGTGSWNLAPQCDPIGNNVHTHIPITH